MEGDVVRFGGAGGEELGGECATYVFSAKRRSSLLKTPSAKKRRVEPSTNHALDASNAACAAALSAADKASDAHDASNAFTALQEHGEGARKVRRTALKALTCVPCGKPLACAVSLPCGHAIDEQCFLQKCFSVNADPTTCACCASSSRPSRARCVEVRTSTRPSTLCVGRSRSARGSRTALGRGRGGAERCARRLDALPDPSLRPLVESLVLERTPSQADLAVGASSLLAPGRLLQAVRTHEEDVYDGCGEQGHVQEARTGRDRRRRD